MQGLVAFEDDLKWWHLDWQYPTNPNRMAYRAACNPAINVVLPPVRLVEQLQHGVLCVDCWDLEEEGGEDSDE